MGRTLISFWTTKKTFDSSKFKKIKNCSSKPDHGLWACNFTPDEEYYSAWELFSVESSTIPYSDSYLRNAITFELTDAARIYTINSWDDIFQLIKQYPRFITTSKIRRIDPSNPQSGFEDYPFITDIDIDFEKLSEEFDGIEFSEAALLNVIRTPRTISLKDLGITVPEDHKTKESYNLSFRIWDVPSICIFNPDVITNVKSFKNDHVRLNLNATVSLIHSFIDQQYTNEQILTELEGQTQDIINLTTLIPGIRKKIKKAQEAQLVAENHYQQKLQEILPLYLRIIHLQTEKYDKIRNVFATDKDISKKLDSINEEYNPQIQSLSNEYFSFLDELYSIKHNKPFDNESQKQSFQSTVEAQFRKLLEKQLLVALQARDTAKEKNMNAQHNAHRLLEENKWIEWLYTKKVFSQKLKI